MRPQDSLPLPITIVAPILLVLAVYWPASRGEFVWDDWLYLVNNPISQAPWTLAKLMDFRFESAVYFRPLPIATFMAQFALGHSARGLHLFDIVVHALNSALVALLVWQLARVWPTDRRLGAILPVCAGMFYAAHPALVEPTAWISGRYDLLATTFLLAGLAADGAISPAWRRGAAVGGFFLGALMCKESAIIFPFLLPLWHLARQEGKWPDALAANKITYLSCGLFFCAYVLLRYRLFPFTVEFNYTPALSSIGLVMKTFAGHIWLTVLPFVAAFSSYEFATPVALDSGLLAPLSTVVMVCAVCLALVGNDIRSGFFFLTFIVALLPVSNLLPIPTPSDQFSWFSGRYLAFPLALFSVFVFVGLRRVFVHKAAVLVLTVWVFASVVATTQLIPSWRDDESFYLMRIRQSPDARWLDVYYANLGGAYVRQAQWQRAEIALDRALKLNPGNASAACNLGVMYELRKDAEKAEAHYAQALALWPGFTDCRLKLARLLRAHRRPRDSIAVLEPINPARLPKSDVGMVLYEFGLAYADMQDAELAMSFLNRALSYADDAIIVRIRQALLEIIAKPASSRQPVERQEL